MKAENCAQRTAIQPSHQKADQYTVRKFTLHYVSKFENFAPLNTTPSLTFMLLMEGYTGYLFFQYRSQFVLGNTRLKKKSLKNCDANSARYYLPICGRKNTYC